MTVEISTKRLVFIAFSAAAIGLAWTGVTRADPDEAAAASAIQWVKATYTVNSAQITIFSKPITGKSLDSGILRIASGADGNLWFAEESLAHSPIVRLTRTGLATAFPVPTANAGIEAVTRGPDNNLWFTEFASNKIGKITTTGHITEYPTSVTPLKSVDIKTGADKNLWFATDFNGIGRATTAGVVTFFPTEQDAAQPTTLTLGPNRAMWYIEWKGNNVGYVTTTGAVTAYPAQLGAFSNSFGIAAGQDGRIWFADPQNRRIGAINTDGTALTFYSRGLTAQPDSITAGPDGNLYFGTYGAANGQGVIGKITTAGKITEYVLPAVQGSFPVLGLTVGADKNIWFANNAHAKVGMLKIQ